MTRCRVRFTRLLGLFGRQSDDREIAAQLDAHLQLHIDDSLRAGMTPGETRRDALLKPGSRR